MSPSSNASNVAAPTRFLQGKMEKHAYRRFARGMVAQQMALERPALFRKLVLVGTAPRGGEDIMHLDKPVLAKLGFAHRRLLVVK